MSDQNPFISALYNILWRFYYEYAVGDGFSLRCSPSRPAGTVDATPMDHEPCTSGVLPSSMASRSLRIPLTHLPGAAAFILT